MMSEKTEKDENERWHVRYRWLWGKDAGYIAIIVLCVVGMYWFGWRGMRFFMVPSESMLPTLLPSDMIVTFKEPEYHRGDIVVLWHDGEYLVKRIAGLPGDSISIVGGALFINNRYASEPYIRDPMRYVVDPPIVIPNNKFFFLGDNRNNSDDSSVTKKNSNDKPYHDYGDLKEIIGRVVFLYYPYNRFGEVRSYPLSNTAGD